MQRVDSYMNFEIYHLKPVESLLEKFRDVGCSPGIRGCGPQHLPVIVGTAGGIYCFWQLGVFEGLKRHWNLSQCSFVGASSGGLVSALAACDVSCEEAMTHAFRLASRRDVFNRRLGLLGIWGSIVRQWLEDLLPQDAHTICSGKVHLLLNEVGFWSIRQVYVDMYGGLLMISKVFIAIQHLFLVILVSTGPWL
eukprot:jgi/Botrbrau1/13201/Bobra.0351s0014.2